MHLKILGGNTAHVDHRRGHNMTKMYSAYEKIISFLKSYFGPLQGHVLIYTKSESWLSCQDSRISGNLLRIMLRHHHGILLTHHDESCNNLSPYFSVILSVFPIIPLDANLLFLSTLFLNILVARWLIGSFIG